MSDGQTNARGQERKKVHWRAFILLPDGTKLPAQIVNISGDGLCLLSNRTFPPNTQLEVTIGVPLPHDASRVTPVQVSANVRYAVLSGEHFQLGMRFDRIADADRRRIHEAAHHH